MAGFFTLLSPVGTISIMALFYILGRLSEKLGAVTKMAPYYRRFWIGEAFLTTAFIAQLLRIGMLYTRQASLLWLDTSVFYLITYHLPLAIGVTVGLVVTWRYWSWLLTERNG